MPAPPGLVLRTRIETVLQRVLETEGDWRANLDLACTAHPEFAEELKRRTGALAHAGLLPSSGPILEEDRG